MANGNNNASLHAAKATKDDEFYTQLTDIEDELVHYRDHFKGKSILLNCDDPEWSNFWKWFSLRFDNLQLKKLTATHYAQQGEVHSYKLEMTSTHEPPVKTQLEGNGDFRSPECLALLDECDIVVTNPPFSLFRQFIPLLVKYNKDFIILGDENKITYKEIFPLIQKGEIWLGYNAGNMWFRVPDDTPPRPHDKRYKEENGCKYRSLGNAVWYTNIDHERLHQPITLYKRYDPKSYPKYDNYDAIEVKEYKDIPKDYTGVMGVPVTLLKYFSPDQFELLGCSYSFGDPGCHKEGTQWGCYCSALPDRPDIYKRLFVRNKHPK